MQTQVLIHFFDSLEEPIDEVLDYFQRHEVIQLDLIDIQQVLLFGGLLHEVKEFLDVETPRDLDIENHIERLDEFELHVLLVGVDAHRLVLVGDPQTSDDPY